jgi:hypothetical protein
MVVVRTPVFSVVVFVCHVAKRIPPRIASNDNRETWCFTTRHINAAFTRRNVGG